MREIAKWAVHTITRGRQRNRRWITEAASSLKDARVLEIGSGRQVDGTYPYSFADVFDPSCDVLRTDVNPDFGHTRVDVTTMDFESEFDVVLCANVLEHLTEPWNAAERIHAALVDGGTALVSVPMMYPLHDEPGDYWRITEHGLRHLFASFSGVDVRHGGVRVAPWGYFVTAVKH